MRLHTNLSTTDPRIMLLSKIIHSQKSRDYPAPTLFQNVTSIPNLAYSSSPLCDSNSHHSRPLTNPQPSILHSNRAFRRPKHHPSPHSFLLRPVCTEPVLVKMGCCFRNTFQTRTSFAHHDQSTRLPLFADITERKCCE